MNRVAGARLWCALLVLGAVDGSAQHLGRAVQVTPACLDLNRRATLQARDADITSAEAAVVASTSGAPREQILCGGLVLNNMAAVLAAAGRNAQAESVAAQSLAILETILPAGDPLLLRPLQILAGTRLAQGKRTGARDTLSRMRAIRIEQPEDSALIHGLAGALLQAERRRGEAEAEDLAALHELEKAGKGETADAASFLTTLASLYIEQRRLDDASRALDRALEILDRAPDTIAMDRIRIFHVRGVLHARQGDWRNAGRDFSLAVSMADRDPAIDPAVLRPLLASYAVVLRKNRRRKDARVMEARASALARRDPARNTVDVTALMPDLTRATPSR